jgi:hypothetical protein
MLGGNADPIVAYPDLNGVVEIAGCHFQDGTERSLPLLLALRRRVEPLPIRFFGHQARTRQIGSICCSRFSKPRGTRELGSIGSPNEFIATRSV